MPRGTPSNRSCAVSDMTVWRIALTPKTTYAYPPLGGEVSYTVLVPYRNPVEGSVVQHYHSIGIERQPFQGED